jgi:hypothetical protein
MSHAEGATRCSPNNPQSSSTMGLSTSNCTNTIVKPSDPVKLQHTLSTQHQEQPLVLATLRGGLASPTASQLCQELRYLRPNETISSALPAPRTLQHERQHKVNNHTWALSTLTATWNKHTDRTTTTPPPPPAQTEGLKMRCLQEGYDAKAPPSHAQMDGVFTLESRTTRT